MSSERFTEQDLRMAVSELAMMAYFPADEDTRSAIMRLLARMVPHRVALIWLVRTMVDRVGRWSGPTELRGVLCTRFRPADGIEAFSTLPGFRPEDSEAAMLDEHEQRKVGWLPPAEGERPKQISADPKMERVLRRLSEAKGIQ